ncbi:MAG: metallophosphoesterase [Deltaproteobacteria bacterium]|jgi:3',5'-cyclic AMP phosphodiesterase CpdA|nr:metallophosphoesterase [Deltaproteobacteria bacterium]
MLIGQITDLHIRADRTPAFGVADTSAALEALEDWLFRLKPPLDGLVMTGDLADCGEMGAYDFIENLFSRWTAPVFALPGNHDGRSSFAKGLKPFCPASNQENLSYFVSLGTLKLIMLDDVLEGQTGGFLSPTAAECLKRGLREDPKEHTIVFSHHPPFSSGLGALDEPFGGREELFKLLSNHPGHLTLSCGHLHQGLVSDLKTNGSEPIRTVVAPPASMPIALEIGPHGGLKFFLGPPGFALHLLENDRLISLFGAVPGKFPSSGPHYFDQNHNSLNLGLA